MHISYGDEYIQVLKLSERNHKTRTERKLDCGHKVRAGTPYRKWVGIVEGEFTSDTACYPCTFGEY